MEYENLIEGEYYTYYGTISDKNYKFIVQFNKNYICTDTNYFSIVNNKDIFKKEKPLKITNSTLEEKAWLEHCIKEDKFVSKEEFLKQYKQEFIVGRWYKFNYDYNSRNITIYGKCEKVFGKAFYPENGWYLNADKEQSDCSHINLNHQNMIATLLTDLNEIQTFLPLGHPDKITTTKESLLEEVKRKYPIGTKYKCLYDCGTGEIFSLNDFECDDYDCIRTNDSSRCVYDEGKWAEIVNKPETKEMSIQEIQEECKKCFPIGCKFKNTEGEGEFTLIQDHSVYKIVGNNVIWASSGYGYLYDKGKYAELIETPEEVIPEYVEYIDTLYKGTIVKVEDWCCGSYCKVIFYNGNKEQPFKHLVKYSTKSAYDLQNLKQLPLTPEQCYNTEIEVGDEVELTSCEKSYYINNYLGQKAIIVKLNSTNGGSYSSGTHWVKIKDNGKNEHWKVEDLKLVKKHSNTTIKEQVDVSSPKVTNEITVPRINTISRDKLIHINIETNTKSITIPKLETKSPEIKNIKIQSFSLTI